MTIRGVCKQQIDRCISGGFWGADVLFNTHLAKKSYCATENVAYYAKNIFVNR
jgi:hypothetical protein